MVMKGYHFTRGCLAAYDPVSKGAVCADNDPCAWLLDSAGPDDPRVFYDMDASVAAFLWHLGVTPEQAETLATKERLTIWPYKMAYFPGRFFALENRETRHEARFYNMGQHVTLHYKPDDSADYAILKAAHAYKIGYDLRQALRALGLSPDKLASPIAAFNDQLRLVNPPTIEDLPESIQETLGYIAYSASTTPWVEAFTLGHFAHAYDYDISMAYPAELARLLDLRRGRWVRYHNYQEGAAYGFARGTLHVTAPFHPFVYHGSGMSVYTPTGTWDTCLTKQEIDLLHEYKLGTFDIADAWWWFPAGTQYELYKGVVMWLYSKRQGASPMQRNLIKRISTAMWGKTIEERGEKFGEWFNPVYGAIVAANVRVRVAKAALEAGVMPLHIAVDGMVTDTPIPGLHNDTPALGAWRLTSEGRCIISGAAHVAFEGDDNDEDFALHYDWLAGQIAAAPDATAYTMTAHKPVTLGLATAGNRFDELGAVVPHSIDVNIGGDGKRSWPHVPVTGRDLMENVYHSSPHSTTVLALRDGDNERDKGGKDAGSVENETAQGTLA